MPTLSTHVPDNWSFAVQLSAAISDHPSKKPGPVIRMLVERALSGESAKPDALSPTVITDLCKRMRPELAADIEASLRTRQPELLAAVLEALVVFAKRKGKTNQGRLSILTATEIMHLAIGARHCEDRFAEEILLSASPDVREFIEEREKQPAAPAMHVKPNPVAHSPKASVKKTGA